MVVVGDGVHDSLILNKSLLEIVTAKEWVFTTRILCNREINLLDHVIRDEAALLHHIVRKKAPKKKSAEYCEAQAKEVCADTPTLRCTLGPLQRSHVIILRFRERYGSSSGGLRPTSCYIPMLARSSNSFVPLSLSPADVRSMPIRTRSRRSNISYLPAKSEGLHS